MLFVVVVSEIENPFSQARILCHSLIYADDYLLGHYPILGSFLGNEVIAMGELTVLFSTQTLEILIFEIVDLLCQKWISSKLTINISSRVIGILPMFWQMWLEVATSFVCVAAITAETRVVFISKVKDYETQFLILVDLLVDGLNCRLLHFPSRSQTWIQVGACFEWMYSSTETFEALLSTMEILLLSILGCLVVSVHIDAVRIQREREIVQNIMGVEGDCV